MCNVNTAVAAMMLPILQSVLEELESSEEMRTMLLLAVAYSANIGGTGTLIGTGPNVVIYETISKCEGQPINFLSWLYFSIPLLLVNLIISWVWLQVVFIGAPWKNTQLISSEKEVKIKTLLRAQQEELGRVTREEYTVIFCFSSLVLLWLFRAPGFIDGWNIISSVAIADATPAIFVAVLLMAVPKASGEMFLPWQVIEKKLQWGVIIVIGGGFALSLGLEKSGLTTLVGHQLAMFQDWNRGLLMFVIQAIVSLITQVASNSATASMLLPVLLKLCLTIKMNPLYLLLPAALSCSYAFILPVSTGPNALVYEASGMKIWSMVKAGLGLNFITLFSTGGLVQLYGTALFDLQSFPDWAQNCTISP
ncbi:solute carrier family 13 member 5 isoform X2 [Eurytemora carolleeae]|uniref:solute carrier family 13 member 5 isoform X2 n=1 Tax=Eurytemora carolleeae TaxID=1294199 RepID=UPI000C767A23|nr:solute carrier family 13 member 5 isoform X2 [Eurytemora carolleeae]|eukprot:XP_023331867.1 solute carrier family 13 member 5-like isoform X2 [Eurytemora affinis]